MGRKAGRGQRCAVRCAVDAMHDSLCPPAPPLLAPVPPLSPLGPTPQERPCPSPRSAPPRGRVWTPMTSGARFERRGACILPYNLRMHACMNAITGAACGGRACMQSAGRAWGSARCIAHARSALDLLCHDLLTTQGAQHTRLHRRHSVDGTLDVAASATAAAAAWQRLGAASLHCICGVPVTRQVFVATLVHARSPSCPCNS